MDNEANIEMPSMDRREFMRNVLSTRRELWENLMDQGGKDINTSCGYPATISDQAYQLMYDREGVAARVVTILPRESWSVEPIIQENEEVKDTPFEAAWKELDEEKEILTYLQRIDELSGIGRFGVLLLGLNDSGADLQDPVKISSEKTELLYLRAFPEINVDVTKTEPDAFNPRFGFPTLYSIKIETEASTTGTATSITKMVHWTRVLHVADNLQSSEVYGIPRMQQVYNRLLDIRKILSGSGEMFWKGAFPGYVFEVNPEIKNPKLDEAGLKEEFLKYSTGLQRYLALEGVTAKSLQTQVANPTAHIDAHLNYIAISLGIPKRAFMGAEQAKLASTTDKETLNSRLENRQRKYITPRIIKKFIKLLQEYKVLPEAKFKVIWPDLNTRTDKEKAEIGLLKTKALGEYMNKKIYKVIPPEEFLRLVQKYPEKAVEAIKKAETEWDDLEDEKINKNNGQPSPGTVASVEATGKTAVEEDTVTT